jgi:hypothetical protein
MVCFLLGRCGLNNVQCDNAVSMYFLIYRFAVHSTENVCFGFLTFLDSVDMVF